MKELMERMVARIRELEARVEALEAYERSLAWGLATEDLELVDAGSAGATQQDWIECAIDGNTGYLWVRSVK